MKLQFTGTGKIGHIKIDCAQENTNDLSCFFEKVISIARKDEGRDRVVFFGGCWSLFSSGDVCSPFPVNGIA